MELPITVMVVLIVALAVGIGVIAFSDDLLSNAQSNVHRLTTPDKNDETQVVRLEALSLSDVQRLSVQCGDQYRGAAAEQLCFIVSGDISDATVAELRAWNGSLINAGGRELPVFVEVSDDINAIFVSYDPLGRVMVTS